MTGASDLKERLRLTRQKLGQLSKDDLVTELLGALQAAVDIKSATADRIAALEAQATHSASVLEIAQKANGINARKVFRLEADLAKLKDPTAVHLNMLRGEIAKPSWAQIEHLYPKEVGDLKFRCSKAIETAEALDAQLACNGDVTSCNSDVPCGLGALAKIDRLEAQLAAARKSAIEDAAKVLDDAAQDWNRIRDPGMANNARSYARKIRALQSTGS